MEDDNIIPFLDEEELQALNEDIQEECTLQELRRELYKYRNAKTFLEKKAVDIEVDNVLLRHGLIKPLKKSKIKPNEAFYVVATLIDHDRFVYSEEPDEKKQKSIGKAIVKNAKKLIKKAMLLKHMVEETNKRMDYWWKYANKIYQ